MPLTGKYLKYQPEITLEMFKEIWTKLINSGWKATCDYVSISNRFYEFKKGEHLYNDNPSRKSFYINYKSIQEYIKDSNHILTETTVQEILGYDPFVKEVIEEVIPEYVECINSADTVILKVGMIYRVLSKGVCSCGTSWYLLEDVNLEKRCTCGNSAPSNAYNLNRFKPSTKEAFDAQNKPKQPLKQAVHCKTQEEWDFTCGKLKRKSFCKFNELGDCIKVDNPGVSFFIREPDKDYQILSFQEWCDLNGHKMEKEVKFEVGKWYKNLGVSNRSSNFGKFLSIRNGCEFWMSECIYQESKVDIEEQWLNYSDQTVECSLEEIQQYLPDNHPDKITPVIQQTRDMQKSNQEFKVDDYVIITKSNKNWTDHMDKEVGKIVKIISITSGMYINYDGKPFWSFGARDGHFRHATPEEINNHLISIGQIPAGEPLNTGIEPNKDGMFKYTTYNGSTVIGKSLIIPGPLKMTLSIDDEELPMVNIIKTKTVNLLNLE